MVVCREILAKRHVGAVPRAGVYRIPPALPYPVDRRNLNVDNITMIKRAA